MKYSIYIFAIAILLSHSHATASDWVTKSGYVGCLSKRLLSEYMTYEDQGDSAKTNDYLKTLRCFELKEGLNISFNNQSGELSPKVQLSYKGVRLWTVREALRKL